MSAGTAGVVIVGAGHAGGSVAALLRQYGYAEPITLLGAEPHAPYQRPPLSKARLKGEPVDLALRPDAFYATQSIALRTDTSVASIDRDAGVVRLADGAVLPFAHCIIATGARPRTLPGDALTLRGIEDADRLRDALQPGARLAIIGGGYIGLEVAASARALGAEAIVLEREPRLLARTASPALAAFLEARHRAAGVDIRLGVDIAAIETGGIRLGDGSRIACDATLVGIGAIPNDELAREAGLTTDGGIVVDEHARTTDPRIFAIGDCTLRPVSRYGRHCRLESVPSATEQAKQAAAAITGRAAPAAEIPWFWSDQYALRLQLAGLPFDATHTVTRGDPDTGGFAIFHLAADNTVEAVEAVDDSAAFMAARQLIARRARPDPAALADPARPLKSLLS